MRFLGAGACLCVYECAGACVCLRVHVCVPVGSPIHNLASTFSTPQAHFRIGL